MDKRLETSRSGYHEQDIITAHTKKGKKREKSKRGNALGGWPSNTQTEQNNDMVPGMEYQHILWQQQQNYPSNGQRLFAAASDPSVCGYTPMPMTYAMEPVSLPTMYRVYQPVPLPGIRQVHGRPRRHCQNHPVNVSQNSTPNGYTSLQENGTNSPIHTNYQNGDYASLPPSTVNKNNGVNGDDLNSEHRRYSDPGLASAEPPAHSGSEDSDSSETGSSITTIGRSNKLVLSLIEQMTELKKSNSQLFKELNEAKFELECIKAKLVQYGHSFCSEYQPGMLSDLIREIREANKSCEEALVVKIKSMVEEKLSQRSSEVEKLNTQLSKLAKEKVESDGRVAKLEEEVATLKLNANNEGREIAAFEEETLALRRELQEARASRTLAENHAAKCVNAVARSVTPVSFETPCITSTPVRTALSDTCSLIPVVSASTSQNFTSSIRPRTADAANRHVPERTTALYTNPYEDTADQGPFTSAHQQPDSVNRPNPDQGPSLAAFEAVSNREDNTVAPADWRPESDKAHGTGACKEEAAAIIEPDDNAASSDSSRDWTDSRQPGKEIGDPDKGTDPALTALENYWFHGRRAETEEKAVREVRRGQNGSIKKPKRKKPVKRSFSEADTRKMNRAEAQELIELRTTASSNNDDRSREGGGARRRTVSDDEDDRLPTEDDQTSRAIHEIPEVTVVGGGRFVPRDLCSTGILTSRVLTAPSRATYTTAYI